MKEQRQPGVADWPAAKQPQHFRLDGPTRLKFMQELGERKTRMEWVRQFMRQLEENATA